MVKQKIKTTKQLLREERDEKIRAVYNSLAPGRWKIEELANMFNCSTSSVWYAIKGRVKEKAGAKE